MALAAAAALVAGSAFGGGAGRAADLAVKVPKAGLYNWTGCYVGGFTGWSLANDWKSTDLHPYNQGGVGTWDFSLGGEVIGGGALGCNWQPNSWLVLGVEGEGGFLNMDGAAPQPLFPGGGFSSVSGSAKTGTGYGLVAGRAGVALDRLLIYGKLGVAFYDSSAAVTDSKIPGFVATGSKSQTPFAVGVGGEYAIYDHWSGKAEYVYFDRGSAFDACGGGFCWKQDPSPIHTVKFGVNYKFW
jgi:outer membrane immunogenic protein